MSGVGSRLERDALPAPRDRNHYHQGDQPMMEQVTSRVGTGGAGGIGGGIGGSAAVERLPPVLEQIQRLDAALDDLAATIEMLETTLGRILTPGPTTAQKPELGHDTGGHSETTRAIAVACERVMAYTNAIRELRSRAEV